MLQGYTKRVSRVSQLSLENTEEGSERGVEASVGQTLSIASTKTNTCRSKGFWEAV